MFLLKPTNFSYFSKKALPWLGGICFAWFLIGMFLALFFSPEDYKQGEIVRIMYLHVPSAWLALGIYGLIASLSFISLVWNNSIASVLAHAAAPAGTVFSAICLITGSIWGKGTWGTWWVWDARLTSIYFPPNNLCTDNAVMVGWAGIEMLRKNYIDSLNFAPRPKWELESY